LIQQLIVNVNEAIESPLQYCGHRMSVFAEGTRRPNEGLTDPSERCSGRAEAEKGRFIAAGR
jgi:hypothetical protein